MKRFFPVIAVLIWVAPTFADEPKAGTFGDVVRAHYGDWTKGSGKLTDERVSALINNPRIKGDEACALAVIHRYLRGKDAPKAVDEVFLVNPQLTPGTKPPQLQNTFAGYRRHLETAPRSLFADGAPQRTGIHQGHIGDCWLISALGQYVTFHPGNVKSMIHTQADGSYLVTLPHNTIRVPALTDAQIVNGSTAGAQGLWLNVLEEAVAIWRRKAGSPAVVADDLNGGGAPTTIELLTGRKVLSVHLKNLRPNQPITKERKDAERDMKTLLDGLRQRKILVTATIHDDNMKVPAGMANRHCYGVIGYDPAKRLITVWNPWGNQFTPKSEPGVVNGYPTKDGIFTMPLGEFVQVFTSFEGQTNVDSQPKGPRKVIS
jgi:Calpain family cysteine protease